MNHVHLDLAFISQFYVFYYNEGHFLRKYLTQLVYILRMRSTTVKAIAMSHSSPIEW